jgi:hypothetical protein
MRALDMSAGCLMMFLMMFLSCLARAAGWMESESTLGAAAVDFHAYEDAFEVRFERTPAGLFAFEIGVHGSLEELVHAAALVTAVSFRMRLRRLDGTTSTCTGWQRQTSLRCVRRLMRGRHRPAQHAC